MRTHLTATNCGTYVDQNTIHLLSNGERCQAATNSGQSIIVDNQTLPPSVSVSNWTLNIQDWSPAVVNGTALTSSQTSKIDLAPIQLTELLPWNKILQVTNASGIGIYSSKVTLEKPEIPTRIFLDVGEVGGSYGIRINGRILNGIDYLGNTPLDVTDYINFGTNGMFRSIVW